MEEAPLTLQDLLGSLSYPVRRTLGQLTLLVDNCERQHHELCAGKVRIRGVSGSLVKDGMAAHAWVLEGLMEEVRVEGAGLQYVVYDR